LLKVRIYNSEIAAAQLFT